MLQLGSDTVRLLSCSQVITSIPDVVKELTENSLDAKATSIGIRLENYGLDVIEVKDNGSGIKRDDALSMAMPHTTSKISGFQDLSTLRTYGFRGEALHSLAAMASVSVTTRTEEDNVALTYQLSSSGEVSSTKPSHLERGTTVIVTNLFKHFPVRRQFYRNVKRCREELKKVEEYLLAFGLGHPKIRFQLRHNKHTLWQKPCVSNFEENAQNILGPDSYLQMAPLNYQCFDPMVKIQALVPKPKEDVSMLTRATPERIFVLVNKRPVVMKSVVQLIKQTFTEAFPALSSRYPVAVASIDVLPQALDVNLEPNKSSVVLHDMDFIITTLDSLLKQVYAPSKVAGSEKSTTIKVSECNALLSKQDSVEEGDSDVMETSAKEKDDSLVEQQDEIVQAAVGGCKFISSTSNGRHPESDTLTGEGKNLLSPPKEDFDCGDLSLEMIEDMENNCTFGESEETGRWGECTFKEGEEEGRQEKYILKEDEKEGRQGENDCALEDEKERRHGENDCALEDEKERRHGENDCALEDEKEGRHGENDCVLEEEGEQGEKGSLSQDLVVEDEILQQQQQLPQACQSSLQQTTLSQWSKGYCRSLSKQPVQLCVPQTPANTSRVNTSRVVKSKLTPKGPPPIFDMINSQPVKRKSSPAQAESTKRQKQSLPSCSRSQNQGFSTSDSQLQFELTKVTKRNLMNYKRSEPLEVEKISPDRVIGFCEAGSSSTKRKIWLALHNTSIICCDPPKGDSVTEDPKERAIPRDFDLETLLCSSSSSTNNFHHLYKL